jgi:hypothetical protein
VAPSAMLASTIAAVTPLRAAANAIQRSCWRSMPEAWRKRTTSDQAPTPRPPTVRTNATAMVSRTAPARAGTATGSTAAS